MGGDGGVDGGGVTSMRRLVDRLACVLVTVGLVVESGWTGGLAAGASLWLVGAMSSSGIGV